MTNKHELRWQDPHWLKQVSDWIQTETSRQRIRIIGRIEQPHIRPWSTVLHIPTDEGMLFFKATAAWTTCEIALTHRLAVWHPDCMPELVAVDLEHGWMLMRNGGEQLRASIRPTKNVKPWQPVITRYAELQIGLAQHVGEILALGIPDHRLAVLPALYKQLLTDEASLMIGREKGLSSAEFHQLQNLSPRFEQICAGLAAFGIPESINHGDFHDGNVLLRNGRITFFDWGDACVTHPFTSIRTFFVSMELALELDDFAPATPEMEALLDCYLEPWQKFAPRQELLNAHRISKPVASIVKTLSWHDTISRLDGSLREEYAWIVPEVLKEFLHHEKLSPA